jgi:alpha-beta hydrolase superfamily lysophospholipase
MGEVDYVVLPYAPGTDSRLYFQPSLSLKPENKWHIFEYSAQKFTTKRYFEELEEFIQLQCQAETLILVAHSSSCRLSLEFLSKSMCYPDALAWIAPMMEPSAARNFLYQDLAEGLSFEKKLDAWCKKLINKDAWEVASAVVTQGEFNEALFGEFENYLWQLSSARISSACTRLPIFALTGGLDPLNSFDTLSLQLKDFHNKTLTELTDIGHCPFIEAPNVLSFLLDDFAAGLRGENTNRQLGDDDRKKSLPDLG